MNKMFKKVNIIILIGAILLNVMNFGIYGADNEISVSKTTVDVIEGDGRTYTVSYTIECSVNETENSDITIIIDRSGSMLFRSMDDDGNYLYNDDGSYVYVVDEVEEAILDFIDEVMAIEGNNLAIVAYGSTATILNDGNYYTDASEAMSDVERLLSTKYTNWYSFSSGEQTDIVWYYDYGINQATNIQAGLEEAQNIIEDVSTSNTNKNVVLFTDGVANTGDYYWESEETYTVYEEQLVGYETVWLGSYLSYSERNEYHQYGIYYSYYYRQYYSRMPEYELIEVEVPVSVITDGGDPVQAAILQAAELSSIDNVTIYTLGYTNGLDDSEISTSADTLMEIATNTNDCYITPTGDELEGLFSKISSKINYMGTDAVVQDILADGFEVVESSIDVSDNAVFSNEDNTELTWNIGNLGSGTHTLLMEISVLDSYYPTGRCEVPTSDSCILTYTDLDGNEIEVIFEINYVNIENLDNGPNVALTLDHLNSPNGEYLVGDVASIQHDLTFANIDGFDYVQLDVGQFQKALVTGPAVFSDAFEYIDNSSWAVSGEALGYSLNESVSADDPMSLTWASSRLLELTCLAEGEYTFNHLLDYTLTNPYGLAYLFDIDSTTLDLIKVKEGSITIDLLDNDGEGIEGAKLIIDDVDQGAVSPANGILSVGNITTGDHTIQVDLPSGYELPEGHSYIVNEDGNIVLSETINYSNNAYRETITFDKLTVRNVAVKTIDGDDSLFISESGSRSEAMVEFETLRDMQFLSLNLIDDFPDSNMSFTLTNVKDSSGTVISGFSQSGSEIQYSGTNLATGEYTAYVDITLPPTIDDGDVFHVLVDEMETQGVTDSVSEINGILSDELAVSYDTTAPVITLTPTLNDNNSTSVDVLITSDGSDIIEYKCLAGNKTVVDFAGISNESGLYSIDASNLKAVTAAFSVYAQGQATEDIENGIFIGSGTYTVYAKNGIGKETVGTITISNVFNEDDVDYDLF